jgi:hypothetical protein
MSASEIYDFEGIVEPAAAAVLAGLNLTAFTTQGTPDFQKDRPRVEIKLTMGPGLSRFVIVINGVNGLVDPSILAGLTQQQIMSYRRESVWQFTLQFHLLTANDIAAHAAYRAQVRNVLAQFWSLINGVAPMTRHAIQMTSDNGSSPILVSPERGMMKTEMSFDGTISVQADAWSALTET